MKYCTLFAALLALCNWTSVVSSNAMAHGGTDLSIAKCDCEDEEEGDDTGRTFECEDEEGDQSAAVLECHDDDDEEPAAVLDCHDEEESE